MQNVMEQWREYVAYKEVFENTDYITKTLGIVVPIAEDGSALISEELRDQIISEHLLLEGFLDSMKKWVQTKAGEVPNLFKSIYKIIKDSELAEDFSELIMKNVINPAAEKIRAAAEFIKKGTEQVGQAMLSAIDKAVRFIDSIPAGWKSLVASMTVAVVFKKMAGYTGDKLVSKAGRKVFAELMDFDFFKQAMQKVASFDSWLKHLAGPIGGVMIVANALAPATKEFLAVVAEGIALNEKATSKAQQRYFGVLKKCKEEGDCPDKEIERKAAEMTTKQIDDFAGTKHKGLPSKVKNEELRNRIRETIVRKLEEKKLAEAVKYHLENKLPVSQNIFRPGSDQFFALFKEVRKLHSEGKYELHESEEFYILETSDLGEWGVYEGNKVPLDYPFLYEDEELEEAKYKGKEVKLGAKGAKRSGDGRAYVYVRDPQSGNIRKVSFGSSMPDAMGDSEAARKRRKNFGDRHDCAGKKDKTKAGYWACRATKMFGRDISGWW